MLRRALSLVTLVCLFVGSSVAPMAAPPQLVCRMTGQPMDAIVRLDSAAPDPSSSVAAKKRPCCVVNARRDVDDTVHYALAKRSCCDLRFTKSHRSLPASLVPTASNPVALPPARLTGNLAPLVAEAAPNVATAGQSAPRAPPRRSASPRAPPTLS